MNAAQFRKYRRHLERASRVESGAYSGHVVRVSRARTLIKLDSGREANVMTWRVRVMPS